MLYINPILALEPTSGNAALGPEKARQREALALEEFEHMFLFTLLQEMRKTIPTDGLFPGGAEREIFDEMMDDALSGEMARSGQLGIAKTIQQHLRAAEMQHIVTNEVNGEARAPVK